MDASGGTVRALFLAQARGTPPRRVPEALAVAGQGFEGDRHAQRASKMPDHPRQLLLVDEASRSGLGVPVGALRENVLVEGLALDAMPPGQRLALGDEVVVELTLPCVPCWKLDALRPGLLKQSWGRRGQLARVLRGGTVREGDAVRLLDINPKAPRPIQPKLP